MSTKNYLYYVKLAFCFAKSAFFAILFGTLFAFVNFFYLVDINFQDIQRSFNATIHRTEQYCKKKGKYKIFHISPV